MAGRKLGQHFLRDHAVAEKIALACRPAEGDTVVEIGPGRGFLTAHLLSKPGRHRAVELDEKFCAELERRFQGRDWRVEHADFMKWDPPDLNGPALKFVGNLPYNASTVILQRILAWPGWRLAVVMLQKEVADRVLADPGSRDYGLLTLSVRLKAWPEPICDVSRMAFWPPPKVQSAVVRLTPLRERVLPEGALEERFFKVAQAAFSQRRKMIVNPLAAGLGLSKEAVRAALLRAGIDPGVRAENVPLEGFARLARELV